MTEATRDLVRSWLLKAEHDLASAELLSRGDNPLLDTAIYHCQQAAEKTLKGYLAFHELELEKTHDIRDLISDAITLEPEFSAWVTRGASLTKYATQFRYPNRFRDEPEPEEFDEALQTARELYLFVRALIPADAHPQED